MLQGFVILSPQTNKFLIPSPRNDSFQVTLKQPDLHQGKFFPSNSGFKNFSPLDSREFLNGATLFRWLSASASGLYTIHPCPENKCAQQQFLAAKRWCVRQLHAEGTAADAFGYAYETFSAARILASLFNTRTRCRLVCFPSALGSRAKQE